NNDGLPEVISFWKDRIEGQELSFTVGALFGPSGCGKSSTVKAGLLPRLAEPVLWVYVDLTLSETEARLLRGLRRRCPAVPPDATLEQALAALRPGRALDPGSKVLIVLDQFEQWLHANRAVQNTQL